jgi:DNA primase
LNRLCATNDITSDKGRLSILRAMAESVHKTGNSVLIDTHAQKTALRLGVPAESVRAEFKKNPAPHAAPRASEEESFESAEPEVETVPPSPIELHLLKLLLLHDELVATAALNLDANWILHPHVRQIVDLRFAAQEHETWHNLAEFLDSCESAEQRSLITEAVAEDRKIPNPETQLADMALKLRNQFLDRQIGALTQKASQPETSEVERNEALLAREKLRTQKRLPLAPLEK